MTERSLTEAAASFVVELKYHDLPEEAVRIARRQILDGLAVQVGGTEQEALSVMGRYIRGIGGVPQARSLGRRTCACRPISPRSGTGLLATPWAGTTPSSRAIPAARMAS